LELIKELYYDARPNKSQDPGNQLVLRYYTSLVGFTRLMQVVSRVTRLYAGQSGVRISERKRDFCSYPHRPSRTALRRTQTPIQ